MLVGGIEGGGVGLEPRWKAEDGARVGFGAAKAVGRPAAESSSSIAIPCGGAVEGAAVAVVFAVEILGATS